VGGTLRGGNGRQNRTTVIQRVICVLLPPLDVIEGDKTLNVLQVKGGKAKPRKKTGGNLPLRPGKGLRQTPEGKGNIGERKKKKTFLQ